MHPQLEKLEQLFSEGKQNPSSLRAFFDEFWHSGDTLPRPEMRKLINSVFEWIQSQVPVDEHNLAYITTALGVVLYHEGNFGPALAKLSEAGKLFEVINDDDGVFATTVMEGGCYRSLGEMEVALKRHLNAAQLLPKVKGFIHFQIVCLYQIGEIYSATGQYDEALKYHQLCEKHIIDCKVKNKQMLSRVLASVGGIYQHQKKYSIALDYLNRSLKLTEEANIMSVKARALTDLGSYYFELGDLVAAADYQQKALAIRNEMNIPSGAVTNMILLAEISVKLNKPDDAIGLLDKALRISEELQVKMKMYQIHLMLSQIYRSKGDLMKALFHFEAYHNIREEVQHEDNEKKIKNLQLVFEAEQTMKENAIIKAQKAEIENKNAQLSETIHELTITKVSRKAKVLTFILGITLIVAQDPIFGLVLSRIGENHYIYSVAAKVIIILSLKPIDIAIERYLLRRIILKKRKAAKAM